jgi:TRAP-type C4-dicarboxylate transport system permease small subunit
MINFMDRLKRTLEYLTVGLTALITVIVTSEVALRGMFNFSIIVSDEASRYLMIWIVMLAGGLAAQTDEHIRIEMLPTRISPSIKRGMAIISQFLTLLFLAVFVYASLKILPGMRSDRTVTLGISMFWIYLALPVGGALMFFVTAYNTWKMLAGKAAQLSSEVEVKSS